MASLNQIKSRMNAIKRTSNITSAMYNISVSKLRKSTEAYNNYTNFMEKLSNIIYNVSHELEDSRLISENDGSKNLFILITSDKGLVGGYHNQLFKSFLETIKTLNEKDYYVFVIGKKGYNFLNNKGLKIINNSIVANRDDISSINLDGYGQMIFDMFMNRKIDRVSLYFNHYLNGTTTQVTESRILPISLGDEIKDKSVKEYMYDDEPRKILDEMIPFYIESKVYHSLADAKLSEHSQRMIAMKNATDNALDVVKQLDTKYHRVRQQTITNELIDVINGSSNK